MNKPKVMLGVIHGQMLSASFAFSLIHLLQNDKALDNSMLCEVKSGPRVAAARNTLADEFLQTDATHLLMIDTDMVIPREAVTTLLATCKPIVGGLYFQLNPDGSVSPSIMDYQKQTGLYQARGTWRPNEVLACNATGAACLMVERQVFQSFRAPGAYPWFEEQSIRDQPVGEDLVFCQRAQLAGHPVHVHTGLLFGHEKPIVVGPGIVPRAAH